MAFRSSRAFAFWHDHSDLHDSFDQWYGWLVAPHPKGNYPPPTARVYFSMARTVAAQIVTGRLPPLQALRYAKGGGPEHPWLMYTAWLARGGRANLLTPALRTVSAWARTAGADVLEQVGLDAAVRLLWDYGAPPHVLAKLPLGRVLTPREDGTYTLAAAFRQPAYRVAAQALLKILMWAYGGAPLHVMKLDRPVFPRRPWFMDRRGQWLPTDVLWDVAGRTPPAGAAPDAERGVVDYVDTIDFRALLATLPEHGKSIHEALKKKRLSGLDLARAEVLDAFDFMQSSCTGPIPWSELLTLVDGVRDAERADTLRVALVSLRDEGVLRCADSGGVLCLTRARVTQADLQRVARETAEAPSPNGGWHVSVNVAGVEPLTPEPTPPPVEPTPAFDAPEIPT